MKKEVKTYPMDKEILTQKSELVDLSDKELQQNIQDLKDTLHDSKEGVGISAVQIGVLKQLCVIHYNGRDIVMINPKITKTRGEIISKEGCLSVPRKVWGVQEISKGLVYIL